MPPTLKKAGGAKGENQNLVFTMKESVMHFHAIGFFLSASYKEKEQLTRQANVSA